MLLLPLALGVVAGSLMVRIELLAAKHRLSVVRLVQALLLLLLLLLGIGERESVVVLSPEWPAIVHRIVVVLLGATVVVVVVHLWLWLEVALEDGEAGGINVVLVFELQRLGRRAQVVVLGPVYVEELGMGRVVRHYERALGWLWGDKGPMR